MSSAEYFTKHAKYWYYKLYAKEISHYGYCLNQFHIDW